jgi:predicted O-methyltransferase YrrM
LYSRFELTKKYLYYYLLAGSAKGHGVHSPFVFDLIKNVLQDKKKYDCYHEIEERRKALLKNEQVILVEDRGAGSAFIKSRERKVSDIASSSLKSKKYAQLLFRIVQYYQPQTMIELGTSLGITAAYLASGNTNAKLYTCEGAASVASIAGKGFEQLNLRNIELVKGDFAQTLPLVLSGLESVDLAFIDGNHLKEPTLEYFTQLAPRSTASSIFIFDDIHWSPGMEEAWEIIREDRTVTLTIDLFFIGLVFFNPDIKIKQHFSIRF